MSQPIEIRAAEPVDEAQMMALLPDLADFELPPHRNAKDLWQGDAQLLPKILDGTVATSFARVAVRGDQVLGLIIVTMREELMSHAPSAHLEAIVVHAQARGLGLGRSLLNEAETQARQRGAASISLHVFAKNERALTLYKAEGYDAELIRAIKWFD